MRTPRKSHSFSLTIPLMAREFKHWRSTSKTTPLPSPNSIPIPNLQLHSACRKTRLKPFCTQIHNEEQAGCPHIIMPGVPCEGSNCNRAQSPRPRQGFREVEGVLPGPGIHAVLEQ